VDCRGASNGLLMRGAYAAGCDAFWDAGEHLARMAGEPVAHREFNRAAIRAFEPIIEKLPAES